MCETQVSSTGNRPQGRRFGHLRRKAAINVGLKQVKILPASLCNNNTERKDIMNVKEMKQLLNDLPVGNETEINFDTKEKDEAAKFTSVEYDTLGAWVTFKFGDDDD